MGDDLPDDLGYLHVSFRRENPTTFKRDFIIAKDLKGPGRFLGCAVGVRPARDDMTWYGEGEIKIYLDGDTDYPTICGTGLEDYVGTAWGMEEHYTQYAGCPLNVTKKQGKDISQSMFDIDEMPDFVSFYRWHVPDPIVFQKDLTVAIQQIGAIGMIPKGQEHLLEKYTAAGQGWTYPKDIPGMEHVPIAAFGIAERVDDYCAAAFVYCMEPQPVPRLDVAAATADLKRLPYEGLSKIEKMFETITGEAPAKG